MADEEKNEESVQPQEQAVETEEAEKKSAAPSSKPAKKASASPKKASGKKSSAKTQSEKEDDLSLLSSYAIIATGGKQYTVSVGDVIEVERLSDSGTVVSPGSEFVFENVLALRKDVGSDLEIGNPFLKTKVAARVLGETKDDKKFIFKKRRRKGFKKKTGHRQTVTRVQIENIGA